MTVTGVSPCLTSTMVIDVIEYALLMKSSNVEMMMFDLEITSIWSTHLPEKRVHPRLSVCRVTGTEDL